MKNLIKRSFDIWVKMRWLKTIDKETDKYNKIEAKRKRQAYVVHSLWKRYNELYSNEKLKETE